jgi:3-dehydroquinate synthase
VVSDLAEIVKHACLADRELFTFLEKNIDKMSTVSGGGLDKEVCSLIAHKNCKIKYRVVKADVRETDFRQVLNLGHTLGRALEPLSDYRLSHGEAVSIGLVFQLRPGVGFGYASENDFQRVRTLLARTCLPVTVPPFIKIESLIDKLHTDKKVRKDEIRFVFQKGIGDMMRFENGAYSRPVSEQELIATLKDSY